MQEGECGGRDWTGMAYATVGGLWLRGPAGECWAAVRFHVSSQAEMQDSARGVMGEGKNEVRERLG